MCDKCKGAVLLMTKARQPHICLIGVEYRAGVQGNRPHVPLQDGTFAIIVNLRKSPYCIKSNYETYYPRDYKKPEMHLGFFFFQFVLVSGKKH